jgi:hypothetical protein
MKTSSHTRTTRLQRSVTMSNNTSRTATRIDLALDLFANGNRVGHPFDAHGHMAPFGRQHELEKAAVAHDQVIQTATVDIAPLGRQRDQRRVDQQLLVTVGFRAAGFRHGFSGFHFQPAVPEDGHVTDVLGNGISGSSTKAVQRRITT